MTPQYPPLLHPPPVTPFTSSTPTLTSPLYCRLDRIVSPPSLRRFQPPRAAPSKLDCPGNSPALARLGPGPGSATPWWWHSNATTNTTSHAPPTSRIRHDTNFARSSKLETKTRQRRPHGPTTPTRIFSFYYDFNPKPAYPASLLPSCAPAPLSGSGDGRGGVRYPTWGYRLLPPIRYSPLPCHVYL